MRTIHDIESNDLVVLARQEGRISVWAAWKRKLAAFHDPALWEGVGAFEQHFTRLDDRSWGASAYGLVVIDFDTRQVLSINDYSTPSSLHPLQPNIVWNHTEDRALGPMQALSRRRDCWPDVRLRLSTQGPGGLALAGLAGALGAKPAVPSTQEVSMAQAMGDQATSEDFMAAMTQGRDGLIGLPALGRRLLFSATFLPRGWVQHDDRGQDMPEFLIAQLERLRKEGFPPPDWVGLDEAVEDTGTPIAPEGLDQLREEARVDPGLVSELALATRYQALKQAWSTAAPRTRPSPG